MPILGIIASSRLVAVGDYESIATVSVGSGGAANVEFTSIPATYTHLQIRALSRNNRAGTFNNIAFQVNSDTGANYNSHLLRGDGSSVIAAADTSVSSIDFIIQPATSATASVMGAFVLDILDYANTNKFKTFRGLLGVDNNGSGYSGLMSGAYRSTSAITSIKFFSSTSGDITQYSHFALYGIKGA
jgi:hypothetical protein